MRPPFYQRQIGRDLERWIADGLVPASSREAILKDVAAHGFSAPRLVSILVILGVVMLGIAAMSFVGANWQEMPRLARLVLLIGATGGAFVLGATLLSRRPVYGHAAILLGSVLYGVSIMLIGQMFHIERDFTMGLFAWAAGAAAAAILIPSRPSFALAVALGVIWSWTWSDVFDAQVHWAGLGAVALGFAAVALFRWRWEFHLVAIAALIWLGRNADALGETLGVEPLTVGAAVVALFYGLWASGRLLEGAGTYHGRGIARYGIVLALGIVFVIAAFGEDDRAVPSFGPMLLSFAAALAAGIAARLRGAFSWLDLAALTGGLAVFGLAAMQTLPSTVLIVLVGPLVVAAIAHGDRTADRVILNLGFLGFGLWALYLYTEVFGSLLDQAAFFFVGGILLIGLSIGLEWLRRRVTAKEA